MKVIAPIAVKFRLFWTIAALSAVFSPLPSHAGDPPLRKGMSESEVLKAWGKPTQVLNESGHISWIYSNADKEVFIPMYAFFHKERTVTITFSHGKVSNYTVLQSSDMMMRTLLMIAIVTTIVTRSGANMVVHDSIGWASNAVDEIANYTLWLKHEADAAATELNTLHTYEQEIVQLARLGDPAALAQLTGVKDILAIYQDYAQITYDFQRMQTYFNPASYQYDMASILNTYRQPNWQGMLAYGGTAYVPAAGNYQFATASFNTAKTAQQTIQSLTAQRQNLQTQRDSALQSLQSATTQSDVQKWTAVLQTLNSSISHIDAQIQQVNQQVNLQQAQISAGHAVYQATQREQMGASMLNGIERDLGSFSRVTGNYLQPVYWNNISGGSVTPNNATMNIPSGSGVVIQ